MKESIHLIFAREMPKKGSIYTAVMIFFFLPREQTDDYCAVKKKKKNVTK